MRKILNEELERLSEDEFKKVKKNPITIILDNVRSMQNVGSIFRTSDAFLIEQIILCGITATPPHRDIQRAALGSTNTVNWSYEKHTEDAIRRLRNEGVYIYSVEQVERATPLQDVTWDGNQPIALVFGHEVKGVQQKIVDQSDSAIEIPQFGSKHSLNISVSTGIVLWQFMRQKLL